MMRSRDLKWLAIVVALAAVYFVAGKLGLRLAFLHASATAVWPPTGLTLAAFLIFGYRVWPGILAGAFLVNLTRAGSVATSIGIGVGNTLEGVVGAYLVNRFANGRNAFDQAQDIFKFAVLTAMVSTTAAVVSERKRAEEQARQLAVRDPATGLANYRRLMEVLDWEVRRSERTGRPVAFLMRDLDHLKKINERYGHPVGTRALCRLADVLRLNCRAIDSAARYGGDEFALILVETGDAAAWEVARRISEQLARDPEEPPLSVSVGVAVYPKDGQTAEALLEAADSALRQAKSRNSAPVLPRP